MAITDISISEELQTNAPSIKYTGNEGPKSPQEMEQMADALLKDEYDQYVYDLLEQRPDATPMSFEEFKMMVIAEGQISKGPVLPNDPTEPVNPFQPKPQGPVLPDRQMAAYGGIMGMDGRKQYGIGSFFQEKIMDPIKKNPLLTAAAAALGYDTYRNVSDPDKTFSDSILGKGIKTLTTKPDPEVVINPQTNEVVIDPRTGKPMTRQGQSPLGMIGSALTKNIVPIVGGLTAGIFTNNQPKQPGLPDDTTAIQLADLKKSANILDQKQGLAANLNFLPAVAARKFTPAEMMETYAQAANGGRIGMAEGGLMDLGGMEKDYRAEGGFVPIGKQEKADDVPARLSVNEFVFTADAVRNAGGGDVDKGAEVMENVMKHLEGGGQISEESQGLGGAREMFETSERLSEVI